MDYILVFFTGDTMENAIRDHDCHLRALCNGAREVGLIFNKVKLKPRFTSVKYMGQILTSEGMLPDPEQAKTVAEMPRITNVKYEQRLTGIVITSSSTYHTCQIHVNLYGDLPSKVLCGTGSHSQKMLSKL